MQVDRAEAWSRNAEKYKELSSTFPVPIHFSNVAARGLLETPHAIYSGSVVLDVCAGPGTFLFQLLSLLPKELVLSLQLVVTDYAEGMIEAARAKMLDLYPEHDKVRFEVMDVQELAIPTDFADIVGCMFGYFVPDRAKAFSEIARVCKAGTGIAVIGTWNHSDLMYLHDDFLRVLGRLAPGEESAEFRLANACSDPEKLATELRDAGFDEADIQVVEKDGIFDFPLTADAVGTLFQNPMFKQNFEGISAEDLYCKLVEYLNSPDNCSYVVDGERKVMRMKYSANLAYARK